MASEIGQSVELRVGMEKTGNGKAKEKQEAGSV